MARQNLAGQRFGRLIAIEPAEDQISPSGQHRPRWKCRCDCGTYTIVRATNLKSGGTSSCGCLWHEKWDNARKRHNDYEKHGSITIGHTANGETFFFDTSDFDRVYPYSWHKSSNGYFASRSNGNECVLLHQVIMDTLMDRKTVSVDHINHDKSDNRKCNLRISNKVLNGINVPIRANNTSGCTGVYWDSTRNKWVATIVFDHVFHHLGRFDRIEDAIAARKTAEEKYFGEYSYDNSMAAVPRITLPQQ